MIGASATSGQAMAASGSQGLDLTQYRGKVVYLDFWASWCAPCKLSFPYMEQLAYRMSNNRFVIVAVDVDHSRDKADAFLSQVGNTLPIVYDPKGVIASKFGVRDMPTSMLIDRTGHIRYVHKGFFTAQTPVYEAQIWELLNEK